MKKLFRKAAMLLAVGALTGCGGVKYETVSFTDFHNAAVSYVNNLEMEEFVFTTTYSDKTTEVAMGVFKDVDETTYKYEINTEKLFGKVSINAKASHEVQGSPKEEESASVVMYLYYTEKDGLVQAMDDGSQKIYQTAPKAVIEAEAASQEMTLETFVKSEIMDVMTGIGGLSLTSIVGNMLAFASAESEMEMYGSHDVESKYQIGAKEGYYKSKAVIKGAYDDGVEGGYDVTTREEVTSNLEAGINKYTADIYFETGKYYVTNTEKVDYTYKTEATYTTSTKVSVKYPDLKKYTPYGA